MIHRIKARSFQKPKNEAKKKCIDYFKVSKKEKANESRKEFEYEIFSADGIKCTNERQNQTWDSNKKRTKIVWQRFAFVRLYATRFIDFFVKCLLIFLPPVVRLCFSLSIFLSWIWFLPCVYSFTLLLFVGNQFSILVAD